jgi:hypothetical protein
MKPHPSIHSILTALAICVLMAGCYTTGGEDPGPVATITGFQRVPELVSPTDTVIITAGIKNLRQRDVIFRWRFKDWSGNWIDESTIGTILNGKSIAEGNSTITDSATVVWMPNGFKGLVLVQFVLEPKTRIHDDASTSFTMQID